MITPDATSSTHHHYLTLALNEARKSPPKPTNFRVGACLVTKDNVVLTTGYTLESPGNTHAEQSCFVKLAQQYSCSEVELGRYLHEHVADEIVLYTTMEPCNKRSVGNISCVDRVLALKTREGKQVIGTVVVGVAEPETFVGVNEGRGRLEGAGIEVVVVPGMEEEILRVATAGHDKNGGANS
ncbi:hypothetical protein LTR62_005213 [Meristemomyces frigidus]|uniref:CMP/dCMP-type deaminase domain-containing protein n=1 Tax=Meristemomyces frigidus TaxID=1508187 RepID=A0AAN7TFQ4_9PEZI|nr:hypothetical protein LTR62_005213 [Meristemomyces frigidus]